MQVEIHNLWGFTVCYYATFHYESTFLNLSSKPLPHAFAEYGICLDRDNHLSFHHIVWNVISIVGANVIDNVLHVFGRSRLDVFMVGLTLAIT